jgi:hypothetical protein
MNFLTWGWSLGALLLSVAGGKAHENAFRLDLSRINDGKTWAVINADAAVAREDGQSVVRLKPKGGDRIGGSNIGLALVEGAELAEGTLEVDLKGKGKLETSFVGVAFGAVDGKTFEAVYFRPFNFLREGPFRARAVQYVAWPEHTWEKLRQGQPGRYEAAVQPVPDPSGWFHARVEVTRNKVRVWVNDAQEPCLVVERLGNREKGKVGIWVDSKEGAFRNLKIVAAK